MAGGGHVRGKVRCIYSTFSYILVVLSNSSYLSALNSYPKTRTWWDTMFHAFVVSIFCSFIMFFCFTFVDTHATHGQTGK